jgi:hypothetical protein
MNCVMILSLAALTTTGLAFIHETRLRRAAHEMLGRVIQALRDEIKPREQERDKE